MTGKRHGAELPEDRLLVRTLGLRLPADHVLQPHEHSWPQLVYATEGVMTVTTDAGSWVVPPERAVWIPAGFRHGVRTGGRVRMRTIYLRPDTASGLPDACTVMSVSPLLRELVLETLRLGWLDETVPAQARLAAVLRDRLQVTEAAPLHVEWPRDPRARRVADKVAGEPGSTRPLADLVAGSGASVRTVERLFRQQTGLTFGRWRSRIRALAALERLAAGESVTAVALAVGYDSTSAFIAMFKRVLGTTPGSYFEAAEARTGARNERRMGETRPVR